MEETGVFYLSYELVWASTDRHDAGDVPRGGRAIRRSVD